MKSRHSHTPHLFESGFSTVTSGGHWFYATQEMVRSFAPGLLKRRSYEDLVGEAVVWIESTDSLAMLLFLVLAFQMPAGWAVALTLLFYAFWYIGKSALVTRWLTRPISWLGSDLFQLVAAALALSFLGMDGRYAAVGAGILFFFLFKVGLLRMALSRWELKRYNGGLTRNDRVLKMVLTRRALAEGLETDETARLEEGIREGVFRMKASVQKGKKRRDEKSKSS
ncbi:MAG: hypothetical protein ACQER4_06245 [Bacteroidota bacterium]